MNLIEIVTTSKWKSNLKHVFTGSEALSGGSALGVGSGSSQIPDVIRNKSIWRYYFLEE